MGAANETPLPAPRAIADQLTRVPSLSAIQRARLQRLPSYAAPVRGQRSQPPLRSAIRWFKKWGLTLLLGAFALGYLGGVFGSRGRVVQVASFSVVGLVCAIAGIWRGRRAARGRPVLLATDVRLSLLAMELAFALTQASGDRDSPLYPAVYLVTAFFAVAPWPRGVAVGLVLGAIIQNALRYACVDALRVDWYGLVLQTGFIVVFAVLYHLILAARLLVSRAAEKHAVDTKLGEVAQDARRLRLIVADRSLDRFPAGAEEHQAARMLLGAVLEVERSVGSLIEGGQIALGGHALALYWLSVDESKVMLRDGRCPAGILEAGPLAAGDGVLGRVLRQGRPVRDVGKISGVNWYTRSVPVRAVLAVPVIERALDGTGYVRGVLVADRLEAVEFSDRDLLFLTEVSSQVARAAEAERLIGELHRAKEAQDRLHHAAEELNSKSSVEEVAAAAMSLVRQLLPELDLVAVTRVERATGTSTHVVLGAAGRDAGKIDGLIYDDNDGVVAHVARLGSPLPARQPGLLDRLKIFDVNLGGFASVRVVPLSTGTSVIGTFVATSPERGVFDTEGRRRLDDLASIVAGALSRALALEEVSRLALVDGLTGLANRRQLDLLAERAFAEATRHERPVSVLVTDLDHFKKVNDTYGHAAGDEVLKAVGAVLQQEARDADVVGRYGGEEFVAVLSDTATEGALLVAERIRRRVASAEVPTAAGVLRVTISIGIASYPAHGRSLGALVKAADEALYVAKHQGRNRAVVADLPPAQRIPA